MRAVRRSTTTVATAVILTGAFIAASGNLTPRADAATGPIPLNCDRACLENLVDQCLAAMVAHDPSDLPLSEDAMYTENDQVMDFGDGFWKTVQERGNYTHIFADPEFGQVVSMGTMIEARGPILMTLRLRVELGRITEAESIYFRPGGGGPNNIAAMDEPGYKPEEMWFKTIPPGERLSRQEMIAITDGYFTGLQKNDGKGINGIGTYPFTEDCHRIENGSPTTNVPLAPGADPNVVNAFSMDCLAQSKLGYYFVVQNIHDRRYPLVDQEHGVVWAHAVFDQGTVNEGTLSDGRKQVFRGF